MKSQQILPASLLASLLGVAGVVSATENEIDPSPPPEVQQLPHAMHSAMDQRPSIRVGRKNADLIGADNRVLQAAVDYIAAL